MALVSEQLTRFLEDQIREKPHQADLLERILGHGTSLELQVNVAKDVGELVAEKRNTYTDGIDQWFNFRVPRNAASTPEWKDFQLKWPLAKYIDCLGSTGWNWWTKDSLWVGYDFDAIVGHFKGRGISADDLMQVKTAVTNIPWVETRRSTSGHGLHLYVFLEGIKAENHTEHAAISRAILSILSDEVDFDFGGKVDVCGGNMWVWARRADEENQGLSALKEATDTFKDLPPNWRDHIPVVTHTRSKVSVRGIEPANESLFTQLASAYRRIPLDDEHKRVIRELGDLATWCRDHYLLQTHTCALKKVPDVKGVFETNSKGTDLSEPNCFMFPADQGAWRVYRFGRGTIEATTWEQDGSNWTTCWYNREPDLNTSARLHGASVLKSGGREFSTLKLAMEAISHVVPNPDILPAAPDFMSHRKAIVLESTGGLLSIQVPVEQGDIQPPGWNSTDRKNYWTLVIHAGRANAPTVNDYDMIIRCLTTPDDQSAGWAAKTELGHWVRKTPTSIKTMLQFMGHPKAEAEQIMGQCEYRPWKMVSLPFEAEYPGNRQWNLNAPQLAITPSPNPGPHPHWDLVYEHIGRSLDKHMQAQTWAASGKEYLQAWFAALIRDPHVKLPLLFLYGPESSGKSILHESFDMLVTCGVVKADKALTSKSDFNGELEKAIVCVVEERELASERGAHAKIKDVTMAKTLSIRRMRTDVYQVENYTHWIIAANDAAAMNLYSGDTRITALYVSLPEKEIPKHILLQNMREEAPYFLRTLLDFRLPPFSTRIRIPMIVTDDKQYAIELGKNFLEMFIDENTEECEGECSITFTEFYDRFHNWLPATERWSKVKVSRSMPVKHRIVARTGNQRYIEGIQWKS